MSSTVSYNSDDSTRQECNQYPRGDPPPAALWQCPSEFVRMNKLQQFQSETVVNRKLLQLWVSDDYL